MERLNWKDGVATVLVVGLAIVYVLYLTLGGIGPSWIGIQDATGMAAVGLGVYAVVTALGLGIERTFTAAGRIATMGLRLVSVALGLLALFGENLFNQTVWASVLAAFVASIVVIWGVTIGEHAGALTRRVQGIRTH